MSEPKVQEYVLGATRRSMDAEITRLREAIIDAKRLSTGEPWRILDEALELQPCAEVAKKTSHNGTKRQHLSVSVNLLEQGEDHD
jgi:hypothetical protein